MDVLEGRGDAKLLACATADLSGFKAKQHMRFCPRTTYEVPFAHGGNSIFCFALHSPYGCQRSNSGNVPNQSRCGFAILTPARTSVSIREFLVGTLYGAPVAYTQAPIYRLQTSPLVGSDSYSV